MGLERDCNALSTSYRTIRLDATLGENDTECRDSKWIDEVRQKERRAAMRCVSPMGGIFDKIKTIGEL